MEGINHILLPGDYALGTRTNVDDDKAPLKAHLHTHTSPGTYSPKAANKSHKSSATLRLLFADFPLSFQFFWSLFDKSFYLV